VVGWLGERLGLRRQRNQQWIRQQRQYEREQQRRQQYQWQQRQHKQRRVQPADVPPRVLQRWNVREHADGFAVRLARDELSELHGDGRPMPLRDLPRVA
jgi:hypothetical protein